MSDMKKIQCRIADVKAVPNSKAQIVSVEFTLGQRNWFKAFRLNYDRPISMEEFKKELVRAGPFPESEEDFLAYIKQEAEQPFEIEAEVPENVNDPTAKVESTPHN